jgi:hypothetical protein
MKELQLNVAAPPKRVSNFCTKTAQQSTYVCSLPLLPAKNTYMQRIKTTVEDLHVSSSVQHA